MKYLVLLFLFVFPFTLFSQVKLGMSKEGVEHYLMDNDNYYNIDFKAYSNDYGNYFTYKDRNYPDVRIASCFFKNNICNVIIISFDYGSLNAILKTLNAKYTREGEYNWTDYDKVNTHMQIIKYENSFTLTYGY